MVAIEVKLYCSINSGGINAISILIYSYRFLFEYIQIFIHIVFLIQIYSDFHSYQNHMLAEGDKYLNILIIASFSMCIFIRIIFDSSFYTSVYRYSYEYIQIFIPTSGRKILSHVWCTSTAVHCSTLALLVQSFSLPTKWTLNEMTWLKNCLSLIFICILAH